MGYSWKDFYSSVKIMISLCRQNKGRCQWSLTLESARLREHTGVSRCSQGHPREDTGRLGFLSLSYPYQVGRCTLCTEGSLILSRALRDGQLHTGKQTPPGSSECTAPTTRSDVVLTAHVSSRCLCLWFSHKHKIPGQQTLHWPPIPCNGPSPHPVTTGISVGIDIHGTRSRTLSDGWSLALFQTKLRGRLFTCQWGQRWLCSTLRNTWVLRSEYMAAPASMTYLFQWVNPARQVRVGVSETQCPREFCPGPGLHPRSGVNWTEWVM